MGKRRETQLDLGLDQSKGAVFSRCRTWRYSLYRNLTPAASPTMNVIGLNPSTATEHVDDPTIRRCIGFAKTFFCGRLVMTNLFAYRATDPKDLLAMHRVAQGVKNDEHILREAQQAQIVVAAWGVHGSFRDRGNEVMGLLVRNHIAVHCFGITKDGHPKHPLYLAKHTPLELWRVRDDHQPTDLPEVRQRPDA